MTFFKAVKTLGIGLAGAAGISSQVAAADLSISINECFNIGGLQLCPNVTIGNNNGHYGGIYGDHQRYRKVEIARGPRGYRCPAGTDSQANDGNIYPGTNVGTTYCYKHVYR
jgi:hypothetical protein